MFKKIQSYVTPILLSYVDKYIKDFKAEDTQVSLWSGSVSLHNLELRPDVIQHEFNFPFTLSSGHIHELLIQVPWMKIVSEPIVITINTIECVLKLSDGNQSQTNTAAKPSKTKEEFDAPPGYVQWLVNRIVSNIAFRCNNVILKYVEEDIVVSVNIKQFYLDNVDGNWVPTFAEITPDDLHTRKLIRLGDITLCLDKRNAAGKIETYLEPLLYKCEVELRLDSTYAGILNKRPKNTRIHINSPKLEFNFSYQQIPMLLRIVALLKALKQRQLFKNESSDMTHDSRHSTLKTSNPLDNSGASAIADYNESWSGWMWSFVQPFPLGYSEEEQDASLNASAIVLFSIRFDAVTFSFKIPDFTSDASGIYSNNQRKVRYMNICTLDLKSVLCETSSHGLGRFCFRGGVRSITLYPEHVCSCGIPDIVQDSDKINYIESTNNTIEESKEWPIEYDSQSLVESMKDSEMLEVCPAFAMDYIYRLTLPEDFQDNTSLASDLEYSNYKEDLTVNIVIGPCNINICSGMIHRLSLIKSAANAYDYAPYFTLKPRTKRQDLPPPSTDDYDALTEHIPKINMKVTAIKPRIRFSLWNHFSSVKYPGTYDTSSGSTSIHRRKISSGIDQGVAYYDKLKNMPSIIMKADLIKISTCNPMYPNRLTYVACQLPDPPVIMVDSCYKYSNLDVNDLQCYLVHKLKCKKKRNSSLQTINNITGEDDKMNEVFIPFITQCNFQMSGKSLLLDEYWVNNKAILHNDYNFNMDNITICGTMAKMIVAYHIFLGVFPPPETSFSNGKNEKVNIMLPKNSLILLKTTLLSDSFEENEMVHLDINFEGLSVRSIFLSETTTHRIVLNGVKIFAINPSKKIETGNASNINQVWIISAPESTNSLNSPFVKVVFQLSTCEMYSTFFTLKIEECSFVMDPLFCNWLTYRYQTTPDNASVIAVGETTPLPGGNQSLSALKRQGRRSLDEIVNRIGSSTRNRLSLGQSSSDREKDYVHGPMQTSSQVNTENTKEKLSVSQEKSDVMKESPFVYNLMKKYFQWKNIAIFLEVEAICVYFPMKPVSALNFDSINSAIYGSVLNNSKTGYSESVFVLGLPNIVLKSSGLKQNLLCYCIHGLPAKLPADIWDHGKISYPWTVSLKNFSCFSMSSKNYANGNKNVIKTNILKPVSSEMTISFTPKMGNLNEDLSRKSSASMPRKLPSKKSVHLSDITLETNRGSKFELQKNVGEAIKKNDDLKGTDDSKRSDSMSSEKCKNVRSDLASDELTTVGVCIHIDTEFVSLSLNSNQAILLNNISHGIIELFNILMCPNIKNKENNQTPIEINPRKGSSYSDRIQCNTNINEVSENLQDESNSKDSDLPTSSAEIFDDDATKQNKGLIENKIEEIKVISSNNCMNITSWIQWTISRLSFKVYASTRNETVNDTLANKYFKLVFAADDIVSSLDIQNEYLKWKTKVVTAGIHHYKRNNIADPWSSGDFCGIIMRGRENNKRLKLPAENCFLFVNITKAKCSSVHNKWGDICKASRMHTNDNDYISEIEVALQELDVILNLVSLEPFTFLFSSLLSSVECKIVSPDGSGSSIEKNNRGESCAIAKSWDCRSLPLCYFEGHSPRFIMPTMELSNKTTAENVVILQMDKISLSPIADNPVCRSPLRPDLYQEAAKNGYLNIPGSELEDRQCQLSVKGISVHTTQWVYLKKSFGLEQQSQNTVSENPALQWNNSLLKLSNSFPIMTILEKVDVCLVLALATFCQSELICGPTIDFNVLSDIELYLSIGQYDLICTLLNEFLMILNNFKQYSLQSSEDNIENEEIITISHILCPYQKYINRNTFNYYKDIPEYCIERMTPASSVDTGIVSDIMSNATGTSKESPKIIYKLPAAFKTTERSAAADYFDIFITFGKISLILFEKMNVTNINASNEKIFQTSGDNDIEKTSLVTKPLLHGILDQPNFSYSRYHFSTKFQFSIFHVCLNLGDDVFYQGLPNPSIFLTALIETKLGIPDSVSDIYPNFLTLQWEKNIGKKQSMKIDVKCPIRITMSLERLEKLNKVIKLLNNVFEKNHTSTINELDLINSYDTQTNQHFLKQFTESYHAIDISLTQVVLAVNVRNEIDNELLLSFLSFKQNITFNSRPEKITSNGILNSLLVSLRKTDDQYRRILINPWTIGFEVNVMWKMWQNFDSPIINPLINIFLETDRLLIELSSEHINILQGILYYWRKNNETIMDTLNQILSKERNTKMDHEKSTPAKSYFWNQITPNDQHYKDDLRAGAFKFIHGGIGNPLPYQVFIRPRGLTWRYPQPRAITRVHSFPVPFQLIVGSEANISMNDAICCTLEYYSDVTKCFKYYAKFYIKQDQRVKLDQNKFDHRTILSATWRVVMHSNEEEITQAREMLKKKIFNKSRFESRSFPSSSSEYVEKEYSFPIKSQALAACLRIDSYFTLHLVPSIQFAMDITSTEINFFNRHRNRPLQPLLNTLKLYQLNESMQSSHVFCSIVLSSAQFQSNIWNENTAIFKFDSDIRCDVVDGSDMLLDKIIECKNVSITFCMDENVDEMNSLVHINHIMMRGGPQHVHTLYTSYLIWKDILSSNLSTLQPIENSVMKKTSSWDCCITSKSDMLIPRYLICNDTNVILRFGQVGTEENILLNSRECYLYSWKTSCLDQQLMLTINLGAWKLSEGFQIEKPGIKVLQLSHDNNMSPVSIIILIEVVSPVQRCVTFMGQLIIMNILSQKFDIKIYQKKVLQVHGISNSPTVTIDKKERSPSFLIDANSDTTIRLHFAEAESGWSGDIPLKECMKGNTPWLVKVPHKGNSQYLSIWCRVVKDNTNGRTLVILSPLYVIKSHLPMEIRVKLISDNFADKMELLFDGKGSSHILMTPGTTVTKHFIFIWDNELEKYNEQNKIPLSYDLIDQSVFFPSKEDSPNIDEILTSIKQWLEYQNTGDNEWPYIFPEDEMDWMPVRHEHNTDIIVRYLSAVQGVDSVIVDMAPWGLLGNCTGLEIILRNSNGTDLCTINHRHVFIPPSEIFKETFYCAIQHNNNVFSSRPLSISTTVLGPYERSTPGCVPLEGYSTITVNCINFVQFFSMSYEIKQNINIFRLSGKYVLINQLSDDLMILPLALPTLSTIDLIIPSNASELSIPLAKTQESNLGTPLTKFNILQDNIIDTNDDQDSDYYALFICLNLLSSKECFSCPVRIDKFIRRRSISIGVNGKSIPIIISCQEYRGQIFITASKDTTPQFLIQNKSNMAIAVAQVLKEAITSDMYNFSAVEDLLPQTVEQECWKSNWHCVIKPKEETFYTMPTQDNQYPELFQSSTPGITNYSENLYLTFAYIRDGGNEPCVWSIPVVVSTSTLEQFVKLPGYTGDIKVMVKNHCYATLVTVNNVTQDDISASDIRQRLLSNFPSTSTFQEDSEFDQTGSSSVEVIPVMHETADFKVSLCDDEFKPISNISHGPVDTSNNAASVKSKKDFILSSFKTNFIFDNINIVLSSNNNVDIYPKAGDVISFICDNVIVSSTPTEKGFEIILTIGNIQIDNPLHPRGGYDFHVILVKQPKTPPQLNAKNNTCDWKSSIMSQILDTSDIIEELRTNCLFTCRNGFEVWTVDSFPYFGWQKLHINIGPISAYLEDTYISTLLDYLTDFVPTSVSSVCVHSLLNSTSNSTTENTSTVSVPEYIIYEATAIANPIRLKILLIEPLNILLSLHSSMVLYLALDHSPLQFAKFERVNILTSSYRFGRALTMHYLSEAIFGVGWVVGSLEIFGSPGGLARRVSAGLRDLVREPCLGLMRGPWGFVVGMTHGSASLLKHLTQGTVESVSMVMGSVARNLDRLSLDEEHMRRTERARRHRPQGLIPALSRGLQGLGLSLLGAIGGIAHEALIAGYEQGKGPTAVAAGLTRGLVGVITKPLSATADFLALTGQGLLHQAGWDQHPLPRWVAIDRESVTIKSENFRLKLGNTFAYSSLLFICQAVNKDTGLDVTIVLTDKWLILLDTLKDKVVEMFELDQWRVVKCNSKTGELVLGLQQDGTQQTNLPSSSKLEDYPMDPALRARIAAYVGLVEESMVDEKLFRLTIPTQHSNHCVTMILFAQFHSLNRGFSVL